MANNPYTSPVAKKNLQKVKKKNPELYEKIMKREGLTEKNAGGKLTEKQKKIDMNKDGVIDDKDFKILNADRTGGSTMTKKKHGGGVCARATGQGFGKARKR